MAALPGPDNALHLANCVSYTKGVGGREKGADGVFKGLWCRVCSYGQLDP